MTRRELRARLSMVGLAMGLTLIGATLLKVAHLDRWYEIVKDLFPLAVAIIAVVVADWLQQRSIFVQSLRSLWSHLIEAKTEVVALIHDPNPTAADRREAFKALSKAIDEVRGVYRNVGETDASIGFFPYEPLHDMRKALLDFEASKSNSSETCERVERAWNSLRSKFLSEFHPPEPSEPIVEKESADQRRSDHPQCGRTHPDGRPTI